MLKTSYHFPPSSITFFYQTHEEISEIQGSGVIIKSVLSPYKEVSRGVGVEAGNMEQASVSSATGRFYRETDKSEK